MRKQYHFKPSKKGIDAWDVDTLINITKNMKPSYVYLHSIKELNENYWFDSAFKNTPTCKSILDHCILILEADLSFPIILSSNGKVMDGMHRVCKAHLEGLKKIKAIQFIEDPNPDFFNIKNPNELPY